MKYRADIDGLRGIAVLAVIFFHLGLGVPGGYVGVDVFFVISGYLITTIIYGRIQEERFSYIEFYERRIRRIVPALVVMVVVTAAASWFVLLPEDYARLGNAMIAQPLMIANVFAWRNSGYFGPGSDTFPLLHTWSLAVEEQFYIVFPLLFVWLARSKRRMWATLIFLLLASLILSVVATPIYPGASFFLLPTRAWELLIGVLAAVAPKTETVKSPKLRAFVGVISLVTIPIICVGYDEATLYPGYRALLPCLAALGLIWANRDSMTLSARFLSIPALVGVGRMSYSLYLYHWPVFVLYRYWHWDDQSVSSKLWLLGTTFLLGWASYRFIETPFRKKTGATRTRPFTLGGCAMALLLIVGWQFHAHHGYPSRFDTAVLRYVDAPLSVANRYHAELNDVLTDSLPRFGDRNGPVKCLIWGDSHAMALTSGLDAACRNAGVQGIQVTRAGIPPLIDFTPENYELSSKNELLKFQSAVLDLARRLNIEVVVLAARWRRDDLNPNFSDALQSTVKGLLSSGIHVFIVRDVAAFPSKVPRMLSRAVLQGVSMSDLGITLEQHDAMNKNADRAFSELRFPGVVILDPIPYFVDERGNIRPEIDGVSLYRDHDHLTVEGSLLLTPMFEGIFSKKDEGSSNNREDSIDHTQNKQ